MKEKGGMQRCEVYRGGGRQIRWVSPRDLQLVRSRFGGLEKERIKLEGW